MPKVTAIPPTKTLYPREPLSLNRKQRVAAYARVSTEQEEQQSSYKAQMDYFTDLIMKNPDWEFAGMYADEGITGTSMKKRDGFNSMVEDALSGKIDCIITKSVSRFARNTVDSLTVIRQLKEKGIDVYFEKENIHTLDAKGELMLTIMSSLAQEESRSISENTTWGQRKRARDGKYQVAFSRFLGYDRGPNGEFVVNEEQAKIVRRIYTEYAQGKSSITIADELTAEGIQTPTGKGKWGPSTVLRILKNEKYKGDALIQKTFTTDFLSHSIKKNEGEVPSYYIEGGHEPIVSRELFDYVQTIHDSRKKDNNYGRHIIAKKLVCAECGGFYMRYALKKKGKVSYYCREKYGPRHTMCSTSRLSEEEVSGAFVKALNTMLKNKTEAIESAETVLSNLNSEKMEQELAEIKAEMSEIVKNVSEKTKATSLSPEYREQLDTLYSRHAELNKRFDELSIEIRQTKLEEAEISDFLQYLKEINGRIDKFAPLYWEKLLDKMVVDEGKKVLVIFRGGYRVKLQA